MSLCVNCKQFFNDCLSSELASLSSVETAIALSRGTSLSDTTRGQSLFASLPRTLGSIFEERFVCWLCCRLYIVVNAWPETRQHVRQSPTSDMIVWLDLMAGTNALSPSLDLLEIRPRSSAVKDYLEQERRSQPISFAISHVRAKDSADERHLRDMWDPTGKSRFVGLCSYQVVEDKNEEAEGDSDISLIELLTSSKEHRRACGSRRLRIIDAHSVRAADGANQQGDGSARQHHPWLTDDRLTTMQKWLSTCTTSHGTRCRNRVTNVSERPRLPTRLICVGQGDAEVRLILTRNLSSSDVGKHVRYASLSHCWGPDPLVTLTCKNLYEWVQQIPVHSLGRTFREAILFCRGMEIPYLWIDSLCIIQDSPEDKDWRIESSLMHHVYGGAYVNVAATASDCCDGGLFRPKDALLMDALEISLPNKVRILGSFVGARSAVLHSFERSPLLSRGWVLQECFMAPRTLHFTEHQVFLQCSTDIFAELEPFRTLHGNDPSLIYDVPRDQSHGRARSGPSKVTGQRSTRFLYDFNPQDASPAELDSVWMNMIEDFLLSRLTRAKDRFHALSGLAALFEKLYSRHGIMTKYLAGCWAHSSAKWLAWYLTAQDYEDSLEAVFTLNAESSVYHCPSWSCFSHGGRRVDNWADIGNPGDQAVEVLHIVNTSIAYEDELNPFGAVTSAVLEVSTQVFFLTRLDAFGMAPSIPHFLTGGRASARITGGRSGDFCGGGHANSSFLSYKLQWDGDRPVGSCDPLHCAMLFRSFAEGYDLEIIALALKSVGPGRYVRLGTVRLAATWEERRAHGMREAFDYFSEDNMASQNIWLT